MKESVMNRQFENCATLRASVSDAVEIISERRNIVPLAIATFLTILSFGMILPGLYAMILATIRTGNAARIGDIFKKTASRISSMIVFMLLIVSVVSFYASLLMVVPLGGLPLAAIAVAEGIPAILWFALLVSDTGLSFRKFKSAVGSLKAKSFWSFAGIAWCVLLPSFLVAPLLNWAGFADIFVLAAMLVAFSLSFCTTAVAYERIVSKDQTNTSDVQVA